MRFFLGMMLGLLGWYLKRYRLAPRHRHRSGQLEDREWDEYIKGMAYRRTHSVVPSC